VKHGVDEEQLRPMLLQLCLQHVEVGAAVIARNTDQLDAVQLQQAVQIEVAGVFDKHRVAGLEPVAHQQVERVACAVRDEDLRCIHDDAELCDACLQMFAQRRIAKRCRVVDQALGVDARDMADRVHEAVHVAPGLGGEPAAELQCPARMVELLQDVNRLLFGASRVRGAATGHTGAQPFGHVKTGAVTRVDIAERDEPVIRFDHRKAADCIVCGELADRGQLRAGTRRARPDPRLHAVHDLLDERHAVVAIEFDIELHVRPPGLADVVPVCAVVR
jgi:hypothetical protein